MLRITWGFRSVRATTPVDEIGAGKVEPVSGEARGAIGQQVFGLVAEEVVDSVGCGHGGLVAGDGMGKVVRRDSVAPTAGAR